MTSDTAQTGPVSPETEKVPDGLGDLITRARVVLWDFDGPICRLFARHSADRVANDLVSWLEGRGLHGVLTDTERDSHDSHLILGAVHRRHPDSDLVAELEERLTQEEVRAASSAMPTPYADPLIRTWAAVGARLAITSNNSPRVVRAYLDSRGLHACFAPHIYGRTRDLGRLKPDPGSLQRALNATGAAASRALMIGDTPSDHEAALRAGVPFLGYARTPVKAEALRKSGAELVVDSLEPLLRLLRR